MTRRFGPFEIEVSTGELRKHGTLIRLQQQPEKILAALLEHPGEVVSREDLVRMLWPDGTFVDYDRGLNAAINRLRQALSDSAESPRYVETVARRGYRFIAEVESTDAPGTVAVATPARAPARHRWSWMGGVLALLACATGIWLWQSRREMAPPALEPVPLTSYEGIETDPSFSPDGTQVAFSWNGPQQDNFDIYVKAVGSFDAPHRLTTDAAADTYSAWSPDGSYIAFRRGSEGIFLVPPTGGNEKHLLSKPAKGQLSWSADGKMLAYAHEPGGSEKGGISFVDTRTGETTALLEEADATVASPAISPDGQTIAFAQCSGEYTCRLGLVRRGGRPRYLPEVSGKIWEVDWTRDGRRLLYVMDNYSPTMLWEIAASAAAAPRVLGLAGTLIRTPAIPRGASRLAFSRRVPRSEIWRLDKGRLLKNPMSSTFLDQSPRLSPTGEKVAFASDRSGKAEIWVANTDGSGVVKLTNTRGGTGSPRWSPDGSRIVYDTQASNGRWDVIVIDVEGRQSLPVVTHPSDDSTPSFSVDGRWIYFSSDRTGRREVYRIPVEGGEAVRMTDAGGFVAQESADGLLYYSKLNMACGGPLFVRSLAGGPERQVLPAVCGRGFEVTPRGIYYTNGVEADGFMKVRLYEPDSGATSLIDQTKGPFEGELVMTVSRDGSTILLAGSVEFGADLYLVENFQ